MVAAILSLGNITFAAGKDEEESVVPAGKPAEHLATTAELLGVDRDGLLKVGRPIRRGGELWGFAKPPDVHHGSGRVDVTMRVWLGPGISVWPVGDGL